MHYGTSRNDRKRLLCPPWTKSDMIWVVCLQVEAPAEAIRAN